jgi:hypothetical protein
MDFNCPYLDTLLSNYNVVTFGASAVAENLFRSILQALVFFKIRH